MKQAQSGRNRFYSDQEMIVTHDFGYKNKNNTILEEVTAHSPSVNYGGAEFTVSRGHVASNEDSLLSASGKESFINF